MALALSKIIREDREIEDDEEREDVIEEMDEDPGLEGRRGAVWWSLIPRKDSGDDAGATATDEEADIEEVDLVDDCDDREDEGDIDLEGIRGRCRCCCCWLEEA